MMNVCLVDDQRAVVDSLKNGIHWEKLPVDKVYTACSAREAKLILKNFPVDVLLSDIEMPEEDGISLCLWAKQEIEDIECIFLTSHADFEYAREAIRLGSFDYILQPVRYEDVEKVLFRVWERVCEKQKMQKMMYSQRFLDEQKNHIFDVLTANIVAENWTEVEQLYGHLPELYGVDTEECLIHPALIQVVRWKKLRNDWEKQLVSLVLKNVLEELFYEEKGNVWVTGFREDRYWCFIQTNRSTYDEDICMKHVQEFYDFIDANMDFNVAFYPGEPLQKGMAKEIFENLLKRAARNTEGKKGVFWDEPENEEEDGDKDAVALAISYIKKNLSKNISRTDVASYVHLNEEYFSRLFRQQTGETFKDYVMMEKMREAQKLLKHSRLSISIIASKVGYDNFSHFSKMFKKITDQTPQEYRKAHEK